jgi:hypothetical protein
VITVDYERGTTRVFAHMNVDGHFAETLIGHDYSDAVAQAESWAQARGQADLTRLALPDLLGQTR